MSNVIAFPARPSGITANDVALIRQHFAAGLINGSLEIAPALGEHGGVEGVHVATSEDLPVVSFGFDGGRYHAVGGIACGFLGEAASVADLLSAIRPAMGS